MARLEHQPLAALYAALIAAGVLAGVIGATAHLAVESVIDWVRGRRT